MESSKQLVVEGIIRFVAVTGLIIGVAFLIYDGAVFVPTVWPFQFLISGITLGISYAVFSAKRIKEGIGILALFFMFSSGVVTPHEIWHFVQNGVYIGVLACAVYVHLFLIRKRVVTNRIVSVVAAGAVIGIANGLVILVLSLFSPFAVWAHTSILLQAVHLNLRVGALAGLLFGIGIEISTFVIRRFLSPRGAGA